MKTQSKVSFKLAFAMLLSVVLTVLAVCIYIWTEYEWLYYLSFIMFSVVAHFAVMHIFAAVVYMTFKKRFRYDSFWFRPKKFESGLYDFLRVKQWKKHLATWDRDDYSLTVNDIETVIMNLCHSEIVHEVMIVAGYLPVTLGFVIQDCFVIFLATSFLFGCVHGAFAVAQRYNRPRFIRIYERQKKKTHKDAD